MLQPPVEGVEVDVEPADLERELELEILEQLHAERLQTPSRRQRQSARRPRFDVKRVDPDDLVGLHAATPKCRAAIP